MKIFLYSLCTGLAVFFITRYFYHQPEQAVDAASNPETAQVTFVNTEGNENDPSFRFENFSIGAQIKKAREVKGLSLADFAANIDMEEQLVSKIELGEVTPTRYLLVDIQELLETELVLDF